MNGFQLAPFPGLHHGKSFNNLNYLEQPPVRLAITGTQNGGMKCAPPLQVGMPCSLPVSLHCLVC